MDDMRELYQDMILDYSKHPRNQRVIEHPDREGDGYNQLCGDWLHLQLALDGEVISDAAAQGDGCAISTASTSMMTEALKGKTVHEAHALFDAFRRMVTGEATPDSELLGKLAVFAGVASYPVRIKCATLPWHTLLAALQGRSDESSTE